MYRIQEEMKKELLLKANVKDVISLLDMKANIIFRAASRTHPKKFLPLYLTERLHMRPPTSMAHTRSGAGIGVPIRTASGPRWYNGESSDLASDVYRCVGFLADLTSIYILRISITH